MSQAAFMLWQVDIHSLVIDPDLIGRRLRLGEHDGLKFSLYLPKDVNDSLLTGRDLFRDAPAKVIAAESGVATAVAVYSFTVRADFIVDLDYLATIPQDYNPTPDEIEAVRAIRVPATATADRVVSIFIDSVAVIRKDYYMRVVQRPIPTLSTFYVGKPPNRVRFGHPPTAVSSIVHETGLSLAEVRQAQRRTVRLKEMPLGWQFFREAIYRMHPTEDPRPAVVEAVTALEVGLKDALRRKHPRSKAVELLTSTDRLRDLMSDIANAVLGQSYAAADKVNYDHLIRLIRQRNALVHRGVPPDLAELHKQLKSLRALLEWLDQQVPYRGS